MKRNKFSLSHYKLFSCDMGELIPCGVVEVLPGDTLQHATSCLVRCQPMFAPVMHPVHARVHHWFVPFRLIWDDWEDFITGGPDGNDNSQWPFKLKTGGWPVGTLADYLGFPTATGDTVLGSMLPFRAYNLIWNEWYRDQDLQTELPIQTTSGEDNVTSTDLQYVCWEKDYFTSARPWEQKGPSITIPIGDEAPVNYEHKNTNPWQAKKAADGTSYSTAGSVDLATGGTTIGSADSAGLQFDPRGNLIADLSSASAVTVGALREAMALQRYEEARARYGSRYTEYLRYLGVRSSDARLQRPEYLGGGKQTIQFSEVLQTAPSDDDPVGQMRGHGIGAMRSNRYRRYFEEHGLVISLFSAKPRTMYVQGLPRMYYRTYKEDYWQEELQYIGQQEIKQAEIRYTDATKDNVFGYQDRYDEYRRQESTVAGEFRTTALDYWHMARIFGSAPALNADFVKCVPTERIFASSAQDVLYVMSNHSIQARRLVAKTGKSFIY